jgi:hypothetical protein
MLLAFVYGGLCALLRLILARVRPVSATEIELLVLRHERRVLRRRASGAAWRPGDRLWLAALSRCLPGSAWHVFPVHPSTLRRWHRELVRRRWAATGERRRPGRPPLPAVVRELIVRLARENPRWGYVRIKGELRKLGHDVSATAVRMTLRRRGIPPAPQRAGLTWPGFLRAQAAGLLASSPALGGALRGARRSVLSMAVPLALPPGRRRAGAAGDRRRPAGARWASRPEHDESSTNAARRSDRPPPEGQRTVLRARSAQPRHPAERRRAPVAAVPPAVDRRGRSPPVRRRRPRRLREGPVAAVGGPYLTARRPRRAAAVDADQPLAA